MAAPTPPTPKPRRVAGAPEPKAVPFRAEQPAPAKPLQLSYQGEVMPPAQRVEVDTMHPHVAAHVGHQSWRAAFLSGIACFGAGILVTLGILGAVSRMQTDQTTTAVGAGVAIGAARADAEAADRDNYGDDWGHQKGGRSPPPR